MLWNVVYVSECVCVCVLTTTYLICTLKCINMSCVSLPATWKCVYHIGECMGQWEHLAPSILCSILRAISQQHHYSLFLVCKLTNECVWVMWSHFSSCKGLCLHGGRCNHRESWTEELSLPWVASHCQGFSTKKTNTSQFNDDTYVAIFLSWKPSQNHTLDNNEDLNLWWPSWSLSDYVEFLKAMLIWVCNDSEQY